MNELCCLLNCKERAVLKYTFYGCIHIKTLNCFKWNYNTRLKEQSRELCNVSVIVSLISTNEVSEKDNHKHLSVKLDFINKSHLTFSSSSSFHVSFRVQGAQPANTYIWWKRLMCLHWPQAVPIDLIVKTQEGPYLMDLFNIHSRRSGFSLQLIQRDFKDKLIPDQYHLCAVRLK